MTPPSSHSTPPAPPGPSGPPRLPAAGSLQCPNCGAASDEHASRCQYCQAPLARIGCPSCFRRLFAGANFCSHCGTRAARETAAANEAEVACPSCKTTMSAVTIGAMTLSECAKCFGVWVTAARFEQLCADREAQTALLHGGVLRGQEASAGAGAITAAAPQVRYRPCPSCKKLMNRVNFASGARAVLDICREHGTFFDRDELHRVVKFIQEGGLEKARARERQLLQQEQARLRRAHLRPDSAQAMLNPEPLSLRDHAVFESSSDLFNVFVHALIDR